MGYADIASNVLKYTYGNNGTPEYRTNPSTGQTYSYNQLRELATQTSSIYNVVNPLDYIAPDREAIAYA